MNLLDLFVKISAKDEASSKVDSIASGITNKLGTAAKAVSTAMVAMSTAAAAGATAVGVSAVKSYAQYEQLWGGVQKLYGNAGMLLEDYARSVGKSTDEVASDYQRNSKAEQLMLSNSRQAYKTAGMSANQYMEQATRFSASLISSLGGDTEAAARQTDVAMRAMSDNVNTFGTDMKDVQMAYQGFAKQNFTMLDNLSLGYKGTQSEMERLIADANEYGASVGKASDLSIDKFSDIVTAIQLIQEKMMIAGTTSREAMYTIEGSAKATKAAWENVITAIGTGNESEIKAQMANLAESIFGTFNTETQKREGGLINNIIPVVGRVADAVAGVIPVAVGQLATIAIDSINDIFGTSFDSRGIVSAIGGAFEEARERVKAVLDALSGAFESFTSTLDMGKVGDVLGSLKDILDDLWGLVEDNVLPALPGLGKTLGDIANDVLDLVNDFLRLTDALSPLTAAITGAALALGGLSIVTTVTTAIQGLVTTLQALGMVLPMVNSFSSLGTAFQLVGMEGGALSGVFTGLGNALSWLAANPVVLVVAAIGAIVAAIAWWVNNTEEGKATWEAFCQAAGDVFEALKERLQPVFDAVTDAFNTVKDAVVGFVTEVWTNQLQPFLEECGQLWEETWTRVGELFEALKNRLAPVAEAIAKDINDKWQAIKDFVEPLVKVLADFIEGAWANMKINITTAVEVIKTVVTTVWSAMNDVISALTALLNGDVEGAWGHLKDAAKTIFDGISHIAETIWQAIKDKVANAANTAKTMATDAFESLKEGVSDKLNDVLSFVRDLPGNILGALGDLGGLLLSAGSSIIDGLLSGMKSAADGLFSWVSGIADTIASLKGPLPYDAKVLVKNGRTLIDGLQKGMETEFEKEVRPYLSGLGGDMSATITASPVATAAVAGSGPLVQVGELVVREEADIYRIAEQLNDLISRQGGSTWSTSYSMA